MFDSEKMRAVNGRMNWTWTRSKLTYFPQKWLSKQKKIKQIYFYSKIWSYSICKLKEMELVNSHTNIQILQNFRWKTLPLLYIKNITNSVWFNRYFETLSKFSKCAMKRFPTWNTGLTFHDNKCFSLKTCVQWTYKWNSFGQCRN